MVMTGLRTPIVTVITGEGGSGGALALAVGDVVLALENSIYSVISPEGAASILWRSADYSAAGGGGDAADRRASSWRWASSTKSCPSPRVARTRIPMSRPGRCAHGIAGQLDTLAGRDRKALVDARYARYRHMGEFVVIAPTGEPQAERPGVFDRIRRVLGSGRVALGGGDIVHCQIP